MLRVTCMAYVVPYIISAVYAVCKAHNKLTINGLDTCQGRFRNQRRNGAEPPPSCKILDTECGQNDGMKPWF
jgi:hypothetical protein